MAHETALGALNEIIESAGGTSDAATLVPAIEQLGEIIGSGGGGGIADGSITTAKLKNLAVTNEKLATGAVTSRNIEDGAVALNQLADGAVAFAKIDTNAVTTIRSVWLVAANSQTDQALTQLGYEHGKFTPKQMAQAERYVNGTLRLCWVHDTTLELEVAPINFTGNLQTQAITLWAKGHSSTASGILGVDDSWTITANA